MTRPAVADPYAGLTNRYTCSACGDVHERERLNGQWGPKICSNQPESALKPFEPIGNRKLFQPLAGGGYGFTLIDDDVRIEVRHLHRRDHSLYGEVDVQCDWAGTQNFERSLSCANQNLSSQTARTSLAKYCARRAKTGPDDFDWEGVVDEACRRVILADRGGDDIIVLDDAPTVTERDFDVHGLRVPADASSMLIAHGDSLKSMVLLYILGTLAQRGVPVLYQDWEWTADRHLARKRRLFGLDRLEHLKYLRLNAPLEMEADRVRRFCDQESIKFIGVDSVGLAANGKLADDDTAIRFHRALSHLPPSLCAAHVPKSSLGILKGDPEAFGSVFFTNLCRASWSVKKQVGASEDLVSVGLFPKKQNDGARSRPVGLEFTFSPDATGDIKVRSVDLVGVQGLAEKLPLAMRMVGLLKRGPLTFAEIADQLGAKVDSVIKAAERASLFTKVPGENGVRRLALVARHVA